MARAAARRLTALTAVTALVTAGGIATGGLAGVASAAVAIARISPSVVSNTTVANTAFTISGSFSSAPAAKVTLRPRFSGDEVTDLGPFNADPTSTASAITFSTTLLLKGPGSYDVIVSEPAPTPSGSESSTCVKCLSVSPAGSPSVTGVTGDGANGDGYLILKGTNFALGARVDFLKPDLSVDAAITFKAGKDNALPPSHTTGYPDAQTIKGFYTAGAGFTPGKHYLRVTNTDGRKNGNLVEFWQPSLTAVTSPPNAKLGLGAVNAPLTLSGSGLRDGSTFAVSPYTNPVTMQKTNDVVLGTATVTAGHDAITAPATVENGHAGVRSITLHGPDGAFRGLADSLTLTAAPTIADPNDPNGGCLTGCVSPSTLGAGGTRTGVVVSGTDFQPGAVFTFDDPQVTAVTTAVAGDGTSATLTVTAGPNATVGGENMTVTNPDYASYTTPAAGNPLDPFPFTINAAPVVTSVNPASLPGGSIAQNVVLSGSGFDKTGGMDVAFYLPGTTDTTGVTVNSVTVNSATVTTVNITVAALATGQRDVFTRNKVDRGTATCASCFGINSVTINQSSGNNTLSDTTGTPVTFTATGAGLTKTLVGATKATLQKVGSTSTSYDVPGTTPTNTTATTADTNFDLRSAAPGVYNAVLRLADGSDLTCSSCFQINGDALTGTLTLAPNKGGLGATDLPFTLTGTNLAKGTKVSIPALPGVTFSETTWHSPTNVTGTVTIPRDTAVGAQNATVSNADDTSPVTTPFEIVPAPAVAGASTPASDHKSIGQGAQNQDVAITGTGFFPTSTVQFSGTLVTATTTYVDATHLTAHVSVAQDAAMGARDVIVKDSYNGGQSDPAVDKITITVTARPVVSNVSPMRLDAGKSTTMTITGQGFQASSVPIIPGGVTFSNTTLTPGAPAGTSLTTTATVSPSAPGAAHPVTIQNDDGGTGTCTCTFTVVIPTALTSALPAIATSGDLITASGKLTNTATGAGLSGIGIAVTRTPQVGSPTTDAVATDGSGNWHVTWRPTYTTTVSVAYLGDSTHNAATAPTRTVGVSTRVTVSFPKHGARSSYTSVLSVFATTSPNKAGKVAYLYRRLSDGHLQALTKTTIASNGALQLNIRLAKGAYTLVVSVPAATGNTTGRSVYFTHYRV